MAWGEVAPPRVIAAPFEWKEAEQRWSICFEAKLLCATTGLGIDGASDG